ncbi:MAG: nuclear transport factor 2 family protein [Paraburkholderia sp.]|uniref:nuclear transport factor 2 family protein n=1 Tax=Paraburkholderia sp. TaxID=1926495 RepID=UPI003C5B10E9
MSEALTVVKEAYAAFEKGDINGLLQIVSEDVDWRVVASTSLPYSNHCQKRAEVKHYFEDLLAAEEITKFEVREFIDAGSHVVVIGFVAATIKSTGKSFESEWAHIFTIRDGMITRWQEFFDTAARL